jgi:flagellar biosynthesis/type III secretory pathway protein FliH
MTPEQQKKIEEAAEAYTDTTYFRLEYSTFGTTAKECQAAFKEGAKLGLSLMQERLDEAEKRFTDLVSEISEPSFSDERISWVEVQIDKEVLKEAREYLSKWGKK